MLIICVLRNFVVPQVFFAHTKELNRYVYFFIFCHSTVFCIRSFDSSCSQTGIKLGISYQQKLAVLAGVTFCHWLSRRQPGHNPKRKLLQGKLTLLHSSLSSTFFQLYLSVYNDLTSFSFSALSFPGFVFLFFITRLSPTPFSSPSLLIFSI